MNKFIKNHKVWCLIPARSGSKTIKKKNLKKILNLSLVGFAIKVSKKCEHISRTFVSTDSNEISKEAKKFGAEVPFLRSKKNSNDSSTDFDVIQEFLKRISKIQKVLPKYIIYFRPTTPLRIPKVVDRAINQFKKLKKYDSLVSVHKMSENVHKKFFIKKNKLQPIFSNLTIDQSNAPRQSFPSSYTANGYLDIIKTENIFKKQYLGKKCYPFIISKTVDIDDLDDLNFARYTAKYLYKFNIKKK